MISSDNVRNLLPIKQSHMKTHTMRHYWNYSYRDKHVFCSKIIHSLPLKFLSLTDLQSIYSKYNSPRFDVNIYIFMEIPAPLRFRSCLSTLLHLYASMLCNYNIT